MASTIRGIDVIVVALIHVNLVMFSVRFEPDQK
jgi:hypothetical protein